jgi:RNA polymerase sigma-70 factor (ECF subfamily)
VEDQQIIELYLKRSENAIKETKIKYGRLFFRIAYNILRNHEDSEECENDTYLKAWSSIPPKEPNPLSAYLGKIARNLALQKYEYYSAKKRNTDLELAFNELEDCIPSNYDTESRYQEGELGRAIDAFLRSIDREARIIFVLRYWHADSVKAIASRFHISVSKVKSSLFRTRNRLKTYLMEEGYDV